MAEVGTVMRDLICALEPWDTSKLSLGNHNELIKLASDCGIIRRWSAAEIQADDEDTEAEAIFIQNEFRKEVLILTPCLRGLISELASGKATSKHKEMLECVVLHSNNIRGLLGTACMEYTPELWDLYVTNFN